MNGNPDERPIRRRIVALLRLDSRRSVSSLARNAHVSIDEAMVHLGAIRSQYRFTIVPIHRRLPEIFAMTEEALAEHPVESAATAESLADEREQEEKTTSSRGLETRMPRFHSSHRPDNGGSALDCRSRRPHMDDINPRKPESCAEVPGSFHHPAIATREELHRSIGVC